MERQEWLKWRKEGIGSSDAGIIMGVSPWKTPLQLWEEKTSDGEPKEESSYITDMGNDFEPKVRSLYEFVSMKSFPVGLFVMDGFPFIRASLDGISEDKTEIIEIKLMGKEDWENAQRGIVAEKYFPQIQHQLMVTGAGVCWNLCYLYEKGVKEVSVEKLVAVPVYPDKGYQQKLIQEEIKFWDMVEKKKPPVPSDRDYKALRVDGLTAKAKKFVSLNEKIDKLQAEADAIKAEILAEAEKANHPRLTVGKLKIAQISKVGNVNYKSIPELKGVDLEKYRGKGSVYWKVTADE